MDAADKIVVSVTATAMHLGSMADPLASWMWASLAGPQQVDHVMVDMDVFDRAAEVEITLRPLPLVSVVQRRHEDVLEEISRLVAASAYWEDKADDLLESRILSEIHVARPSQEQQLPCIWRVRPSISGEEREAYEPKLVSIGPLHHGRAELAPMEKVKLTYLRDLLARDPEKNKLSNYIRVIRKCESRAREQYSEAVQLCSNDFVKMLLVDGCFIIEYLVKRIFNQAKKTAQLSKVRWGFSDLRRDLMLFENQIPFFVLESLFEKSNVPFTGEREEPLALMDLALKFLRVELPKDYKDRKVKKVYHLLHLRHLCLDPNHTPDPPRHCSFGQCLYCPLKKGFHLISLVFFGLLYLVLIRKWPWCGFSTKQDKQAPRMIPSATVLHESGVKFKKREGVNNYLKVSFTKEGTLEIPFLSVEGSTSSKLRNFIALEQCCPQVGSYFTSYAVLMDNIINTDSDVAILQKYKIIEHKLGNDKEVAEMFSVLCKGTHLTYDDHYNVSLFKDVKQYAEVPHNGWRASLRNTHLSSPWPLIGLVAGLLGFAITVTQLYFSIFRRRKN